MNDFEREVPRKLFRGRKSEALEWLRAETPKSLRVLGELEHEPAVALVESFYEAGATQMLAVEITNWSGGESSNYLLVELPSEQGSRERLLHLQAEVVESRGFEGTWTKVRNTYLSA